MKSPLPALLAVLAAAASLAAAQAQTQQPSLEAAPARTYDDLIGPLTTQQQKDNEAYKLEHKGASGPVDPASVAGLNGYANMAAAGVNGLDGALRAAMAPSCPDIGEKSCQSFTGGTAAGPQTPDGVTDIRTASKETVLMNDPLLKEAPLPVDCPKGADCAKALQMGQALRDQQGLIAAASDATERSFAALKGQALPAGKSVAAGAASAGGSAGPAIGVAKISGAATLPSDAATARSVPGAESAPAQRPDGEPSYRAPAALAAQVLGAAASMDRGFAPNGSIAAAGGSASGGMGGTALLPGQGGRSNAPKVGGPTFDSLRRDINKSSQNGAIQALMNSQDNGGH